MAGNAVCISLVVVLGTVHLTKGTSTKFKVLHVYTIFTRVQCHVSA